MLVMVGGTWEHRKRALEMNQTAFSSFNATSVHEGGGSHHMGDYLPQELFAPTGTLTSLL